LSGKVSEDVLFHAMTALGEIINFTPCFSHARTKIYVVNINLHTII